MDVVRLLTEAKAHVNIQTEVYTHIFLYTISGSDLDSHILVYTYFGTHILDGYIIISAGVSL